MKKTDTTSLIECRTITKTYGEGDNAVTVLKGVDITIHEGEFVAIVGPSGSGKSTLMHILGALDTPSSGAYSLRGINVENMNDNELAAIRSKHIGFVFQAFNLLARATVWRNVALPLIYNKSISPEQRKANIQSALEGAGFDKAKFFNKTNQLSGGQMQRVAIARALVNNPSIIMADEPTGNLDQKTGKIVMKTFADLHASGKTIILITHDMQVASYASRIITIQDGEIISDSHNKARTV
jgi:putative ABC transport system ATP-binding protein